MYTVGDIIWVVNSSYPGVKPYQVVEETTHKTLSGTLKTFYVKSPEENSQPIQIESLDGEIFTDPQEVKQELVLRATRAIEKMMTKGEVLIKNHFTPDSAREEEPGSYSNQSAEYETSTTNEISDDSNEDENFITLPDGTKARLNIKGDIL